MFRNRFDDAFPRSSPSFGPQELEFDITEPVPGSRAEGFLCAILGLLLNRKQDVKYAQPPFALRYSNAAGFTDLPLPPRPGHYNRALEDAVTTHRNQWPAQWEGKNPVAGDRTFASMTATERVRANPDMTVSQSSGRRLTLD